MGFLTFEYYYSLEKKNILALLSYALPSLYSVINPPFSSVMKQKWRGGDYAAK
jgi:hypothetical protein